MTHDPARSLGRNWVLFVFGGLLAVVVGLAILADSLVGAAPGAYQAGYAYGFAHAPSPTRALATSTSPGDASVATQAVDRCTTELQFIGHTVSTGQQWKSGCEAGWIKKAAHATMGTEAMTTTAT